MTTRVAALVVFWEKPHQTIECIKSLLPHAIDIYILDNGSSPEAHSAVREFCVSIPKVTFLSSPENLGVAGGRNKLIEAAISSYDWLFFVDNDMTCATPNLMDIFSDFIAENPDACAVAGFWTDVHTQTPSRSMAYSYQETYCGKERTRLSLMPGGMTFIKSNIFKSVGLLNPEMRIGFEDYEFMKRAEEAGIEVVVLLHNSIRFLHDHRFTERKEDKKVIEYRYNIKSYARSFEIMQEKFSWSYPIEKTIEMVEKQKQLMLERPNLNAQAFPQKICLYMTSLCNFACKWCYRNTHGLQKNIPSMTQDLVEQIDKIYPEVSDYSVAGQGEPTLAPEFSEIVTFLHNREKDIRLTTNGTNITPILEVLPFLNTVSISLYGPSDESYQRYCGVSAFTSVLENFRRLRDAHPNIRLSYIVNKEELDDLEEILGLCDSLQPSGLSLFNPLWYDLRDITQREKILTTQDVEALRRIEQLCQGRTFPITGPFAVDFSRPLNSCRSYCRFMSVDGEGNIGGCGRQYVPAKEFGNILLDNDAFNSYEMQRLRRNQLSGYPAHPECVYCFGNWMPEEFHGVILENRQQE